MHCDVSCCGGCLSWQPLAASLLALLLLAHDLLGAGRCSGFLQRQASKHLQDRHRGDALFCPDAGSDTALPFHCSSDHVLAPAAHWQDYIRLPGFLELPQVSRWALSEQQSWPPPCPSTLFLDQVAENEQRLNTAAPVRSNFTLPPPPPLCGCVPVARCLSPSGALRRGSSGLPTPPLLLC